MARKTVVTGSRCAAIKIGESIKPILTFTRKGEILGLIEKDTFPYVSPMFGLKVRLMTEYQFARYRANLSKTV